ncbi:MAG: DNA polymerase III subunit beta [Streptosporangiales bacterium]|nr:DNA polymerase III subunit beta [Streptosporangiales bacterium]
MKFRVERDALADAVAWTARTLPARPPVPVLAGMLLEADNGQLLLSSFDYEVSARVSVDIEVDEPGRALVSGRLLAEITKSLPSRPVEVGTDGSRVILTCGSARFGLLTLPVEDYPALPDMPTASGVIPSEAFAGAVGQVAVAAGRDDTLPVLTGVRLEISGDSLTFAATDRYRLAVREIAWQPESPGAEATALVPARTLADTAKALTAGDKVSMALSSGDAGEGLVGFESSRRRTTTRLIEGDFPQYRSLLPSESATVAKVDTAALVDALRRVALVADRNSAIRLGFSGGELLLEAGSGDEAQAAESLDCAIEGDDVKIAFNPGYLLDGLGVLDAPVAIMSFTTSKKPVVITPGAREGETASEVDYRYLLMPMRLPE